MMSGNKNTRDKLKFTIIKNLKPFKNKLEDASSEPINVITKENKHDYALLKLSKPSILQEITIIQGSLKSFQVFSGWSKDKFNLICEGKIKHDDSYLFSSMVRNKINGVPMPSLYIKFYPLQYSHSFDIEQCLTLYGSSDEKLINQGISSSVEFENTLSLKLCLKYLRQRGYMEAFESLSKTSNISIEHPLIQDLYKCIVKLGDFENCERIVQQFVEDGYCDEYIKMQRCTAQWTRIGPTRTDVDWPKNRGGHQICVDSLDGSFYLFGGWDGCNDLSDLWKFDFNTQAWTCLSMDVSQQGGPSARSCHKMCIDMHTKKIYTLGRYLEHNRRMPENLLSDFYCYNIANNTWELINSDTNNAGGPQLMFDHQMAIDDERKIIYVFGGNTLFNPSVCEDRLVQPLSMSIYLYNIPKNQWELINRFYSLPLIRTGHSFLYNTKLKYLFFFGGHHQHQPTNDFHIFDTTDGSDLIHLDHLTADNFLPEPIIGFTHRSTIDSNYNEIYVLSGINKDMASEKHRESKQNSLWLYNIEKATWFCVYNDELILKQIQDASSSSSPPPSYPVPRFAHQFIYDSVQKVHYLFGGNPNQDSTSDIRLNDLWSMKLHRLDRLKVKQDMKFMMREHRYIEMTHHDKHAAVTYLQNELGSLVDLMDKEQIKKFESLPSVLFQSIECNKLNCDGQKEIENNRKQLFDRIVRYLPEQFREPHLDLMDLLPSRTFDPVNAIHA